MAMVSTDLVARTRARCEAQRRPDLAARLTHTTRRLADPGVRILVVGEFKQGKSQLVNALVNAPVCPVDDDIATAVPTEVGYGDVPSAALLLAPPSAARGRHDLDPTGFGEPLDAEEEPVPIETLAPAILGRLTRPDGREVVGARALLPRTLLKDGLAFVDTPGVGGLASTHSLSTMAALPSADAVILVTDASSEFTAPEVDFLRQALGACPTVMCVVTKTDLFPDWRRVVDIDRDHLQRQGLALAVVPVSSTLRLAAAARQDRQLNEESGFPELVRHLQREVLGRRDQLLARSTAHDVSSVVDNLRLSLLSEREALEDPTAVPEMVRLLNEARARTEELKRRSSRWQSTLSDGVADLNADLEHDLKDRLRVIVREAEQAIDASDPGQTWPEFSLWFEQRVSAGLADTFLWADRNAGWLLDQVGQHFSEDADSATPRFDLHDTSGLVDPVSELGQIESGDMNVMQKVLVGLRGSYGGILMFGLITGLAGIPLVNPVSVGAGLLLGTKAYRDDVDQRLKRRRAEAKVMVRKYADEVIFYVAKQLRDRLRVVQRTVRDHYTEVAEELSVSLRASVATAQAAAAKSTAERTARLAEVRNEIARLDELATAAAALGSGAAPVAVTGRPGMPPPRLPSSPAPPSNGRRDPVGTAR
jgi:hypothetical protein